jgi:hypothetical protein
VGLLFCCPFEHGETEDLYCAVSSGRFSCAKVDATATAKTKIDIKNIFATALGFMRFPLPKGRGHEGRGMN